MSAPRPLSPARSRAIEVLREIFERGGRATTLLLGRGEDLVNEDRNLLRELVLGVLRNRFALDAEIASACRAPLERLAPDLREILEVALYQIRHLDRVPAYAAVDEAVRHARESAGEGAAKLVNAVLRNILRNPPLPPRGSARGGLRLRRSLRDRQPREFKTKAEDEAGYRVSAGRGRRPLLAKRAAGGVSPRQTSVLAEAEGRFSRSERPEGRGEGETSASLLACQFSHPEFLVARWLARLGEETTRRILAADNVPSGLDLLVNPLRTTRGALRSALAEEGTSAEPSPLVPLGLSVLSGNPLRSPLFAAGHFSVQDIGSQALPLLLPHGETLLDLAAAPGGKSFAALFSGRARQTIAIDRSLSRLRLLVENARRLGIERALPVAGDFGMAPLPAGRFSRVLLDVPCSGTGTLRKNPEIRYRVSPDAIKRLSRMQEEALLAAAELLEPGGFLLYSTCSLEEEENERVVTHALANGSPLEPAEIQAPEGLREFVSGNRFRIFPAQTNDGFTAHLLRRRT